MKEKIEARVNIKNKQARFEYHVIDTYIAGIVLRGTEIKSIRQSKVQITDAFCQILNGECFLVNMHIGVYEMGTHYNHNPRADRKLLLKKKEINKLEKELQSQGNTLVPLRLFIGDKGLAKIEIALAKGKKLFDKREDIKARDVKREMDRGL
jgi:SsrA-binding protein